MCTDMYKPATVLTLPFLPLINITLNLFSLPEEIILKILEDGDYRAILACKHVCSVPPLVNIYVSHDAPGVRHADRRTISYPSPSRYDIHSSLPPMACYMVHVLLPLGKRNAWKGSQHTRRLGTRYRGLVVLPWTHSLAGENRFLYLGTSSASSRTLEYPTKNCFCSAPRLNCGMWWKRLGRFNFRVIYRMSVSTLRWIYLFVGVGMLCVLAYRVPHPDCHYIPGSNPFGSAPFRLGESTHLRSMLVSSTLRAHGDIALGVCVSVATALPLHVKKGSTYPSGTGSLANTR